jgi:hypothetical protein
MTFSRQKNEDTGAPLRLCLKAETELSVQVDAGGRHPRAADGTLSSS